MLSRLLTRWMESPGSLPAAQLRVAIAMSQHGAGTVEAIARHTGLSRRTVSEAMRGLFARSPVLGIDPTRPKGAIRAAADPAVAAALSAALDALMVGALSMAEGRVVVAACLWAPVTVPALAAGLRMDPDRCREAIRTVRLKGLTVPVQDALLTLRPAPRARVLRLGEAAALGQAVARHGLSPAVVAAVQRQSMAA